MQPKMVVRERERRNIMPCQDWNKTTRDVPTGRPKKDQRRPWRSYKSRRQAAALLSCCKCAAELACLPACMPAHFKQSKHAWDAPMPNHAGIAYQNENSVDAVPAATA